MDRPDQRRPADPVRTGETAPEVWCTLSKPTPFDVIASATLSLKVPADYHGYEGRSHSLWYADAQTKDQYQWFETAFMDTPLRPTARTTDPFALAPHHESRATVSPEMKMYQVAWPFIPLGIGDLDELISRWADWLAQAAPQPPASADACEVRAACDSTGRGSRKTVVGRPVVLPPGVLSGLFPDRSAGVPVRCGAGPA
ncbi:hypothetical protein ACWCQW_33245 [Streptomyces mirabilis]